ncbi:hypothetical protein PR048_025570 [Dryococelus australis]|uniref:Uncharacterized protein n=1 Tax=Dryococelus australis TaxID=614101 RepID=A0ABQ9GRT5_9NEOP|nr:hypothetical protein PR048_025570 [Dryococelus australis]
MAVWMHFVECHKNKPGQSIESFIETINNIASKLEWGDREKLVCCKLKLKGQVQNVLQAYPQMKETRVWDNFVTFLYKNFKPHKSRASSFENSLIGCKKETRQCMNMLPYSG